MRRFYTNVTVAPGEGGYGILLDARPVRTPAKALLALPTAALAQAVADEWRAQGETIDPATMAFTGLANAAIDHVAANRASFVADIADYGGTDLLCYRAEGPESLVARQAAAWNPLLDWAQARYDIAFTVTAGIIHVAQPAPTLERLHAAVDACDIFTLAGLSTLVALSGSLACGLAVIEGAFTPEQVWAAAEIDEAWQVERWGEDEQAAVRAARRAADFVRAHDFCAMVRG